MKLKKIEEVIIERLIIENKTITTVESCTGGLLAARLLDVAGASQCFNEGYITYSNEAKERLVGVESQTLLEKGAVSKETAFEMAVGGKKTAGADICLSTTGIAGPGGGTKEKPVGLIYIGCSMKDQNEVRELRLTGDRGENRAETVEQALQLLYKMLNYDMEK